MPTYTLKKLSEICEISIGKTPPRGGKKFWDTEKISSNVWLSIADLSHSKNKIISDSKEYISDLGASLFKPVEEGTLLVSFKLTLGRLAFAGKNLRTNEAIAALKIKDSKKMNKYYLYYFLSFFDWVAACKGDTKVKGRTLNKAKLREIEIPLPPLTIQEEIVVKLDAALASVDEAITKTEQALAATRELWESTLEGTFRGGDGWEEKQLGEVYDVRDGTHDSPKYHATGYPLITSKNLQPEGLSFSNIKLISEKDYQKINERSKVHKGDILFAMIGTIGNATIVEIEPEFAIKNVALFKVPKNQNNMFLKHFLSSKTVFQKMISEAKGTTQKFVGLGYLRNFPIRLPSVTEQSSIVAHLDAVRAETDRLSTLYEQKLADLDELRRSVMQEAFAQDK